MDIQSSEDDEDTLYTSTEISRPKKVDKVSKKFSLENTRRLKVNGAREKKEVAKTAKLRKSLRIENI